MPLVAENHEVRAHFRNVTDNRVSGTSRTHFTGEGYVMLACDCFSAGLHPAKYLSRSRLTSSTSAIVEACFGSPSSTDKEIRRALKREASSAASATAA